MQWFRATDLDPDTLYSANDLHKTMVGYFPAPEERTFDHDSIIGYMGFFARTPPQGKIKFGDTSKIKKKGKKKPEIA